MSNSDEEDQETYSGYITKKERVYIKIKGLMAGFTNKVNLGLKH